MGGKSLTQYLESLGKGTKRPLRDGGIVITTSVGSLLKLCESETVGRRRGAGSEPDFSGPPMYGSIDDPEARVRANRVKEDAQISGHTPELGAKGSNRGPSKMKKVRRRGSIVLDAVQCVREDASNKDAKPPTSWPEPGR
jgi:hypothetical protein